MIVGHIGGGESVAYQITKSLRFRSSASAYLSRTFSTTGNRKTWTWSGWVKRGALGTRQFITMSGVNPNSSQVWQVEFNANDKLEFYNNTINSYRTSTRVFRDPAAPMHLVFCADTNNATAQNRFRCWINGEEITAWDVNSTISLGYDFAYNGAYLHGIGAYTYSPSNYLDGYLSEINFIDGQALGPESFGQVNTETGQWIPKKYTGSYGTNGFYLPFNDGTNLTELTKDRSGNSNNWTATNISLTAGSTYDWMDDTPTNNFAVLNPLFLNTEVSASLSNANLTMTSTVATNGVGGQKTSSIFVSSGKWYAEVSLVNGGANYQYLGIQNNNGSVYAVLGIASITNSAIISGSSGNQTGLGFATNGDIIGIAFDADSGTVKFFKNNVQLGVNQAIATGADLGFLVSAYYSSGHCSSHINFGQRPFTYTPPTGFKALCTKNLPTPVIANPKKHFDVKLWVSTGGVQTITGMATTPEFLWSKDRNTGGNHILNNIVTGSVNVLSSNNTNAEVNAPTVFTSFNSDGFSLGSGNYWSNTTSLVSYGWKAGGAPVSNTSGSITSQVSANPTAGFSIVTYTALGATNQTFGHGLGVAPRFVIFKRRDSTGSWVVWHQGISATQYLLMDSTAGVASGATMWNSTAPSSTVVSLGTTIAAGNYVAYCFAEVPGFSKIGSYTGNGSADGPFIYCGFKPRFVMIKRADAAQEWFMWDASRIGYNQSNYLLFANSSQAEYSGTESNVDLLSNGFKIRAASPPAVGSNASGGTYIFLAIAETPFNFSTAR